MMPVVDVSAQSSQQAPGEPITIQLLTAPGQTVQQAKP